MAESAFVTEEICKKHRECMARELATKTQDLIEERTGEIKEMIEDHDAQAKEILSTSRENAIDNECTLEISRNLATTVTQMMNNYSQLDKRLDRMVTLQEKTIEIQAANTQHLSNIDNDNKMTENSMKFLQNLVIKLIVYGGTAFFGMLGAVVGLKYLGIPLGGG